METKQVKSFTKLNNLLNKSLINRKCSFKSGNLCKNQFNRKLSLQIISINEKHQQQQQQQQYFFYNYFNEMLKFQHPRRRKFISKHFPKINDLNMCLPGKMMQSKDIICKKNSIPVMQDNLFVLKSTSIVVTMWNK